MNEYKVGKFRNRFVLLVVDFSVASIGLWHFSSVARVERASGRERKVKKVIDFRRRLMIIMVIAHKFHSWINFTPV